MWTSLRVMEGLLGLERMSEEHRSSDGSCVVVSGWHYKYGHVVCKVLASSSDRTEIIQSREVQILRSLSHCNICPVFHITQQKLQNRHYFIITMPFVATNLAKERHKRMKLGAHWKEAELWSILMQVTSALCYTQEMQVCHRDLKPSNLLLEPTGRVLVADFGSGKMNTPVGAAGHSWVGTIDYVSPELQRAVAALMLGDAQAAAYCPYRSDVFSLGVTLLSLMRLDLPQYSAKAGSADRTVELITLLGELRPRYSEELLIVIGSMIEHDPELRPSFVQLEATLQTLKGPAQLCSSTLLSCQACHDHTKFVVKLACQHYYCRNCLLAYANSDISA